MKHPVVQIPFPESANGKRIRFFVEDGRQVAEGIGLLVVRRVNGGFQVHIESRRGLPDGQLTGEIAVLIIALDQTRVGLIREAPANASFQYEMKAPWPLNQE